MVNIFLVENYNRFVLDLVLREVLNNAVIHGNHGNREKMVRLTLRVENNQFVIEVEDEGEGFDWKSVVDIESNPEADHGRGFPIFQAYCSDIGLNDAGNRITLKMNIEKNAV